MDDAADNPTFYADLTNPQSLNKYQYTYNNPLRFTDPDGHCPLCPVAQRVATSPTGQQIINGAGAAVTVTVVAASGVAKKAWEWFTTPNPNFKMNTFCSMGLDCSGAYKNQYLNQSNEQNSSANQAQQQGQSQEGNQTEQKTDSTGNTQKSGGEKPKKERNLEGTQVQRENIEQAQKVHRKAGRRDRIGSIEKSKQNEKNELKKIKSSKDVEDP